MMEKTNSSPLRKELAEKTPLDEKRDGVADSALFNSTDLRCRPGIAFYAALL